ncbi:Rap1-interacting factor 1 N terminal-domain-containing protein [Xylariaceae sp. FL0016]|nr:Rap1-interacting factor 1 N terminal-domain-containing protein [Xylariaceae sp. FL0016]
MVSQVAVPSRGLDALPTRPPTPPREKQSDLPSASQIARNPINSRLANLQTPPSHSSQTTNHSTRSTSTRTRKRVEFTIQADYREPPSYPDKENVHKQSTPVSAPSSAGSMRPIKSILKQSSSPAPPNPLDPVGSNDPAAHCANLAVMLESNVKELASSDRDMKIDAYTTLVRALKTSNNLPDRIALQGKMGLFMQFIQRDITLKSTSGSLDSSLVNHALTLLATFLHFPAIASTLSPDFGVFIIDHCIRSFEDRAVPKDVIRHLMQVIAFQDFPSKVMTSDRVGRLVASLHQIEDHMKGKSIIMSRILIYRRLIKQSRMHMITHSDWLLDLFTDMLSSMKEIRATAITLGLDAGFTIGKEKQLCRKVMEILQMTADDTKYVEHYEQRLLNMTKNKHESASVPQIWSVIILLLRCPVDRWEFFPSWLGILQRCFNSGDFHTKLEANFAWNRLVYALHLHEPSFSKTLSTLCQPFFSQLKRRNAGKQSEELRKVVFGSVCNLFYYTLKPNLNSAQIDAYWDTCIRPLIQQMAFPDQDSKSPEPSFPVYSENLLQAIAIATSLFDSSMPRLWKEDRVSETSSITPDELPALDPKWIRHNSQRVFSILDPILSKTFLDLAHPSSGASMLWRSLVGAVAAAASKEVKVSADTAAFLGHALTFFWKIWSSDLTKRASTVDTQTFIASTESYLNTMTTSLGPLPFTEKLLSMNKQNTLVPAATPSHRSSKGQAVSRPPLLHLFSILSTLPKEIPDDDRFFQVVKSLFEPFFSTRSLPAKKVMVQELMQTLPTDGPSSAGAWLFIAEVLSSSLENTQSSRASSDSLSQPPIGHEYRDVIKHLERGIKYTPHLAWEEWNSLFLSLVTRATEETGEAGCSIAVIEPLAKILLEDNTSENDLPISPKALQIGIDLISTAKHPRDRQALDAARRRLWGTSAAGSRSASFETFDSLYNLINRLLQETYTHLHDTSSEQTVLSLITEVSSFLARCSQVLVFKALVNLQPGICCWIQDAEARFGSRQSQAVSEAVETLWNRICSLFADNALEHCQLDVIEPLLCSAFSSKHRHIVNSAIALWNRAFDQADDIRYPEALKAVLLSLHPYADILLPGLDMSSYESNGSRPSFVESQDDLGRVDASMIVDGRRGTPRKQSSLRRSATPGSVQLSLPRKRPIDTTPSATRQKSARLSGTPRLRHDNSQIQFAPIQSSSPAAGLESQVLTDRQREVRERQRENETLFPSIRSSVEKAKSEAQTAHNSPVLPQGSDASPHTHAATPQTGRTFEDYVSSTPTPRRGQAPMLYDDHEMTDDVPSSPPEPRRNLLEEMKSRSRTNSVLESYPMSSSPIGSPAAKHQTDDIEPVSSAQLERSNNQTDSTSSPQDPVCLTEPVATPAEASATPTNPDPAKATGTPKSDDQEFLDALTSPTIQTPRTLRSRTKRAAEARQDAACVSQVHERSFEMSDGEERSMARLVVEIDSRKCSPLPTCDPHEEIPSLKKGVETRECITVSTNNIDGDGSDQSSPIGPSNSAEVEVSHSLPGGKGSAKKQKRDTNNKRSSNRKRRHGKYIKAEDVEAVADSQEHARPHASDSMASEANASAEDAITNLVNEDAPGSSYEVRQRNDVADDAKGGDLSRRDEDDEMEGCNEAVHLQLITEASQHSEAERASQQVWDRPGSPESVAENEEVMDVSVSEPDMVERASVENPTESGLAEETPAPEKSTMEVIMGSLRAGLEGLRAATLSREEVYKVEDMFMDIKKELYAAESRSRK